MYKIINAKTGKAIEVYGVKFENYTKKGAEVMLKMIRRDAKKKCLTAFDVPMIAIKQQWLVS